jgi:hypothetical protein
VAEHNSFGRDDLLVLMKVADATHTRVMQLLGESASSGRSSLPPDPIATTSQARPGTVPRPGELLAVSQGLGELLRLERDSGVPAMSSLVDAEMTNLVRNMVRDLEVSGIAGLTKYDARVAAQLAKLTTPGAMLDPVKNLAELHAMVDHWFDKGLWCAKDKEATKAQMGKEVRDKSIAAYDTVALAATSDGVLGGLEDALLLTNKGYTKEVAKHLMTTPSFTLFRFAALEALALYYYALGRKSAQITDTDVQLNQTLDTTYLGYGLACQQLRTAENLVRRLDAGLRRALSVHFP